MLILYITLAWPIVITDSCKSLGSHIGLYSSFTPSHANFCLLPPCFPNPYSFLISVGCFPACFTIPYPVCKLLIGLLIPILSLFQLAVHLFAVLIPIPSSFCWLYSFFSPSHPNFCCLSPFFPNPCPVLISVGCMSLCFLNPYTILMSAVCTPLCFPNPYPILIFYDCNPICCSNPYSILISVGYTTLWF